eukprot:UN17968
MMVKKKIFSEDHKLDTEARNLVLIRNCVSGTTSRVCLPSMICCASFAG